MNIKSSKTHSFTSEKGYCVTACRRTVSLLRNDATSVTSTAVDEFQRPVIVVTSDVIYLTAVVARDHNLVAMTTNPRVV